VTVRGRTGEAGCVADGEHGAQTGGISPERGAQVPASYAIGKEKVMYMILGNLSGMSRLSRGTFGGGAGSGSGGRRRRRKGFTLVEVIVVLVILAILAAIAIPALTGYIDKARLKNLEMMARTQMIAVQIMITEQRTRDGGIVTGDFDDDDTSSYFRTVVSYAGGLGYRFAQFTDYGEAEYIKLTGDTESIKNNATGIQYAYVQSETDLNGAIVVYEYYDDRYFSDYATSGQILNICYFRNVTSTDPVTQQVLSRGMFTNADADSPTSGWNIGSSNGTPAVWKKL
jgi:prepilin-type N-terminal cleavage/methylation domain-containing protein